VLDAAKLLPDCRRVADVLQRLRGEPWADRGNVAGHLIDEVPVPAQRIDESAGVLRLEALHKPLEDAQYPADVAGSVQSTESRYSWVSVRRTLLSS